MTKFLRLPSVKERTGISRSSIYDPACNFPKPVKLGPRAVGWVEAEVEDWITSRIAARQAA